MNDTYYIQLRGPENLSCRPHLNSELEFIVVEKGTMSIKYDNHEETLAENEASVVLPYRLHSFEATSGTKAKVIMFSYSIAEEFYNQYKGKDTINNQFVPTKVLMEHVDQMLEQYKKHANLFVLKGLFYSLMSEYIDNHEFYSVNNCNGNVVREVIDYAADKIYDEDITLNDISVALGINKAAVSQIFENYLDISLGEFINNVRIEKAMSLLTESKLSISEVAYTSGFGSLRNFNRIFKKWLNCTPLDFRRKYQK